MYHVRDKSKLPTKRFSFFLLRKKLKSNVIKDNKCVMQFEQIIWTYSHENQKLQGKYIFLENEYEQPQKWKPLIETLSAAFFFY